MHSDLSSLSLSCDQLWDLCHHRLLTVAISSTRLVLPLPLVYRVAGDFPSPPLPSPPLSICPWNSVALRGHSGVFVLPEKLFHIEGVDAPWQLNSPSYSLAIPSGVFRHSGGLSLPLS